MDWRYYGWRIAWSAYYRGRKIRQRYRRAAVTPSSTTPETGPLGDGRDHCDCCGDLAELDGRYCIDCALESGSQPTCIERRAAVERGPNSE